MKNGAPHTIIALSSSSWKVARVQQHGRIGEPGVLL